MTKYYTNEDNKNFLVGLRALDKYNKLAYKQLLFDILPKLRNGEFIGETKDKKNYKVKLSCDETFKQIHGQLFFTYTVDRKNKVIYLNQIEPFKKLLQLYQKLSKVQNGVPLLNDADAFKLNLLKYMKGNNNDNKWFTRTLQE